MLKVVGGAEKGGGEGGWGGDGSGLLRVDCRGVRGVVGKGVGI